MIAEALMIWMLTQPQTFQPNQGQADSNVILNIQVDNRKVYIKETCYTPVDTELDGEGITTWEEDALRE